MRSLAHPGEGRKMLVAIRKCMQFTKKPKGFLHLWVPTANPGRREQCCRM